MTQELSSITQSSLINRMISQSQISWPYTSKPLLRSLLPHSSTLQILDSSSMLLLFHLLVTTPFKKIRKLPLFETAFSSSLAARTMA